MTADARSDGGGTDQSSSGEETTMGTDQSTAGADETATGVDSSPDGDGGTSIRARLVRVGHVLGVLLLIAIVLPFLLFAVPQLIGAEASYVVTSGSMEPAIGAGDITFVNEVDPATVQEGTIINFQRGQDSQTTTHRVIEVVERDGAPAFRTAGDNNDGPDQGVVTVDEFRGQVMEVGGAPLAVPYVGYAVQYAGTQTGFTLLFVIPVTLLVLNEVWNVVSSARSSGSEASVSPDGGETREDASRAGSEGSANEDGSAITFSTGELRLAIVILVAFVAYGGWTTFNDLTPLNVGVTGSAAVGLLLLAGLYVVGGDSSGDEGSGTPSESPEEDVDGLVVHNGAVDREGSADVEPVHSFELLLDVTETSDGRLLRDPDAGVFHLTVGGTLYVYDPGSEGEFPEIPDRDGVEFADGGTASYWGPPPASGADDSDGPMPITKPIGEGDDA